MALDSVERLSRAAMVKAHFLTDSLLTKHRTDSVGVIPNCASERRHKAKTTLFAVPFFASRARPFQGLVNVGYLLVTWDRFRNKFGMTIWIARGPVVRV